MSTQHERATVFRDLHVKGDPVIVFNIWDPGSARVLQEIGANVIATGSWSVAVAHGFEDGEQMPLELALANLKRIVAAVDLPVTLDVEGGYGQSPAQVRATAEQVIDAGAVGINFEDQVVGGDDLYSLGDQCARISAIRAAADERDLPLFINARTDLFLKADPADHGDHFDEAVRRARAYAEAGASGFFAPGLRDAKQIEKLCELAPLPVNIMVLDDTPPTRQLAALGVARISYGPGPYRQAMNALKEAGRSALSKSQSYVVDD